MKTLKYRFSEGKWSTLYLRDYTDIETSVLWRETEKYSGKLQVIYSNRRFQVRAMRGNAGRLIVDSIAYAIGGKSSTGQLDYGSAGSVKWYFEPSAECGVYAVVWCIVYVALVLYGCWYIPVWLVVIYFIWKRQLALKEWK